jgi:C1A family cysteine protease
MFFVSFFRHIPWQDHAVSLVGFNLTATPPYYLVRNSWGVEWGENGYIKLEVGQNTCGLTTIVTSAYV